MAQLDLWVLAQAFAQLAQWQLGPLAGIPIGVNISAASLQTLDFVQQLEMLQARYPQLPHGLIKLEVLESSALEDLAGCIEVIRACRRIGVQFALDDFGTGYSSLTYLRRLPADQLKIDQSFVRDMLTDLNDHAIVQGVLGLAQAFDRQVIAEGVETYAIGQALLEMGCYFGQGYGIARPMDAQALVDWQAGWRSHPVWTK
jgi:EAL domain-containing protein (putative c-di-GMP-specific phosphodiesterase class I)